MRKVRHGKFQPQNTLMNCKGCQNITLYGDATTSTIFLHQVGLYGISVTAHHHFLIARLQLQIYSQALDYFLLCGMV